MSYGMLHHSNPWMDERADAPDDDFGWRDYPDEFRIKKLARELSLNFRREISAKATALNVPTIKYKWQYLLEEVIADMERFV